MDLFLFVSVVIPVYNAARYLDRCLDGLLSQNYDPADYEIIMVDNNSTDDSAEIIRRRTGVKMVSENKQGAYAARNRGITLARGDVLAFTDPDCVPVPGWLAAITEGFRDPAAKIILGCRRPATEFGIIALVGDYENCKDRFVFTSRRTRFCYGYTNNMAVRSETWRKYGPFLEWPRGADTIFVQRVVREESCEGVQYREDMLVRHLELATVREYLAKVYVYGRSRQLYRSVARPASLGIIDRLRLVREALRGRGVMDALRLFTVLAAGLVCWNTGSLTGTLANTGQRITDEKC